MLWYRACAFSNAIEQIIAEGSISDGYLTIKDEIVPKNSKWTWYRRTREEAKSALITYWQKRLEEAHEHLNQMRNNLQQAKQF